MPLEPNKKTLLIIDDEPAIRHLIAHKLTEEGFNVIEEEDGASALSKMQIVKPDMILCDIRMPGMNGFQVLKKLRASNDWGAHVPVIFLTNMMPDDDATLKEIESIEPAFYLMKNQTNVGELVAKIRERLSSS